MSENEVRGNIARFDLSTELLAQALQLPDGVVVERMHISNGNLNAITVVVSSSRFREVMWGEWIPEITPMVHYEDGRLVIEWEASP